MGCSSGNFCGNMYDFVRRLTEFDIPPPLRSLETKYLPSLLWDVRLCFLHGLQDLFGDSLLRFGQFGVGFLLIVGRSLRNLEIPTAHVPVPYKTGVVENLCGGVCRVTRKEKVISRLDAPCYENARHRPHE